MISIFVRQYFKSIIMRTQYLLFAFICLLAFSSCKKETTINKQTVVDNYLYEINGETLYQSNVEKTKQKSAEQFISIAFSNLFQTTIDQNNLNQLAEVRLATGDKQMADELILNSLVNSPNVTIPTNAEMRSNIEQFIKETFIRFFLREPSPYETFELKKAIEDDPALTPELIYQGFALSNEYKFY